LGQLTSPVVSAQALDNWLQQSYKNPDAPLGSIELLLSPPLTSTIQSATRKNIEDAFDAWLNRCRRHPDNVALFYFCGHGIEAEILVLLPEDFGADPNRLWNNAIDFDGTFFAMGDCAAQTQCYFIDVCRETPIEALRQRGRVTAPPLKSITTLQLINRDAPVFLAAPFGEKAHALKNHVSYFTTALIDCLDRFGARGRNGVNWVVNTDSLKTALKVRMHRTRLDDGSRLKCDISKGVGNLPPTDLHEWPGPGVVQTDVLCRPILALEYAHLSVVLQGGGNQTRSPNSDPWELNLDAAPGKLYDVTAAFDAEAPFHTADSILGASPQSPYQRFILRANP
jgi:hypothetical protein